jgi:hypothetical protein
MRDLKMREAVERHLAERRVQRAGQQPGKLDHGHAEVLPAAADHAPALGHGEVREGLGDIGQRDPAAARQCQCGEIAEPPAYGERDGRGQSRRGGAHARARALG